MQTARQRLEGVSRIRRVEEPSSGEWIRTFAIITTDANELVADIHDRMPAILSRSDYVRWLGEEQDPRELMRPFPSQAMRIWPISTRVSKPENDDPTILDEIELGTEAARMKLAREGRKLNLLRRYRTS